MATTHTEQPQAPVAANTLDGLTVPEAAAKLREVPQRERLPDTRQSITHKFSVGGNNGYITVGLYPDGRPGEVFLNVAKEGSTVGGLLDTIGILASLCLQYGVPVESLARKFERTSFPPSGETTNVEIPDASSLSDYIFSWMGLQFSEEFRAEYEARKAQLEAAH